MRKTLRFVLALTAVLCKIITVADHKKRSLFFFANL